ncbi:MAG: major capsid protein P2 [Betaproteobacteria bacterium]
MSVGKLRRNGLPFFGVAASVTTSQAVTPGRTIEEITLQLGGGAFVKATHVSMVRVRANGKNLVEASGAQLDAIVAYRGGTVGANTLPIPFADYRMEGEFSQEVGAFDTSVGVENLTVEVDIGAATTPTLRSVLTESAQQRNLDGTPAPYAGLISKILRYPFNVSAGGDLVIPVPFGPVSGALIKRAHLFASQVTRVNVKQDGVDVYDQLLADANEQATRYGRVPQSNVFTVDFVGPGHIGEALDTRDARSIEWRATFSGAASGFMVVEYLDSLLNL